MKKRPPCSAQTWEEIERVARNCSVPVSALVAALLDRVVTKHMRPVQWCIVAERARHRRSAARAPRGAHGRGVPAQRRGEAAVSGGHWPAPRDAEELIDEWLRQCTRAALSLDERIVLAKLVDALVERVNAAGGDYL